MSGCAVFSETPLHRYRGVKMAQNSYLLAIVTHIKKCPALWQFAVLFFGSFRLALSVLHTFPQYPGGSHLFIIMKFLINGQTDRYTWVNHADE